MVQCYVEPRATIMTLGTFICSYACLLDTGCDVTLVPQSVISVARHLAVTGAGTEYLQAASGTQIVITGKVS